MPINNFVLSLFWMETHLELLEVTVDTVEPVITVPEFLGDFYRYKAEFNNLQHLLKTHQPFALLSPPWPGTKGQNFWTYYTGKTNADVTGNEAWKKLIPFHASSPLRIKSLPLKLEAQLETPLCELFFYPHGIAFAITLTLKDASISLEELIEVAFALRFESLYLLNGEEQTENHKNLYKGIVPLDTKASLSLNELSEHGLSIARTLAYGKEATPGKLTHPTKPFSVFTVLNGKDVDFLKEVENNGTIQKTLHAITNWKKPHEGGDVLNFDAKVNVGLGQDAGSANVLYGQPRGRAIWYPSKFISDDPKILYGLPCYHRNIFLASLQTESLCGFAVSAMERIRAGKKLSSFQPEVARHIAGALGRLFGGTHDTYRSFSPRRQITDNNWEKDVNDLRINYDLPPLHP